MIEDQNPNPLPDLPPELSELDRELLGIRMEERPSFGPELGAELGRAWIRRPGFSAGGAVVRNVLAASVAALIFTGLAVPPARASLVTHFQRLLDVFQEPVASVDPATASSDDEAPAVVPEPEPAPSSQTDTRELAPPARSSGTPIEDFPPFSVEEPTYPTLVDMESDRRLIRRHYPPDLQRRGIGGTVDLQLWVDSSGAVDNVMMRKGSGVPALDRAAMQAATSLRFHPATRGGRPVGTYVTFPLTFEPQKVEEPLPEVPAVQDPQLTGDVDWELPEDWTSTSVVPAPIRMEARDLLRAALAEPQEELEARFGPLDGLLAGDPPAGVSPMRWRSEAARALERAMSRDPDNPAPYLALARIRRKQGLREDAGLLLERGIERARLGTRPVSPRLAAELAYEHGRVVKESWLGWENLGRLPVAALDGRSCPRRAGPSGDVDVDILIAWNYLCSDQLDGALTASWTPVSGGEAERAEMLNSFREAVDAYPGHVGANVEILLDMADQALWMDVLNGARRFAWATGGHPYSLLLSGLALQRLGRSEEAEHDLERALSGLGDDLTAKFDDPTVLEAANSRVSEPDAFWAPLDPVLNTDVNERYVEHLARAAYAYLRFGDLDSDAARVWLRYGRPQTTRDFGNTAGSRTEFWDYGQGPDITFTRPSGSEERRLTSEADSYLDDLRKVFPQWYGTRARRLYTLPAQVARFEGSPDGSVELEVALTVPEELRSEAPGADSLDLGIFLLGPAGEHLSATRRRISARSRVVRLRDDAGPAVSRVAVELYDAHGHQAAAVRLPVRRSDVGRDSHISDLLFVEAAAPMERDIGRSDAWVSPLTRGDLLNGDQAGVLFELYDLPEGVEPYRLRVELESETTHGVMPVAFRPAGQTLFGTEWARRPAGRGGRAVEYLTLDLAAVGPDTYTLRTIVELPGGDQAVEERRGLRRQPAGSAAADSLAPGLERIERE